MDVHVALERAGFIIRRFEVRIKRAKTEVEVRRAFRLLRLNLNRIKFAKD